MTMKQKLAIVALAVAGISGPSSAPAQLARQSQGTPHKQQQVQSDLRLRARSLRQRRDSWYERLLKQFNPTNFDYGGWMEERRQVFLNESVRNPYFRYSAGVTLGLLLVTVICAKQRLDHHRALWITAEMMADLYSHNLYSRDVAEKATRKYNDHIERCNHAIEAGQQGSAIQGADPDHALCNEKLNQVMAERNEYLRQLNDMQAVLKTKEQTVGDLSLGVDGISVKSGSNQATGLSLDLNTEDSRCRPEERR
jgi:hypothetical protein